MYDEFGHVLWNLFFTSHVVTKSRGMNITSCGTFMSANGYTLCQLVVYAMSASGLRYVS